MDVVKLDESTRRSLVRLVAKSGAAPLEKDDVVVLIVDKQEALISHTKVRGPVSPRELRLRLAGARVAVEALAADRSIDHAPQLAVDEAALLDDAGLTMPAADQPGALEQSRIEYEILLRDSLTVEQAAKALGVSTGRLRQRLAKRTLYGIKERGAWRLPKFQFGRGRKLVRGIERVLPHIRPDAHPLSILSFFTTPHQDLVIGDKDTRVAPLDWLAAGRPPADVATLAEEI